MRDFINSAFSKELKKLINKYHRSMLIMVGVGLVLIIGGIVFLVIKLTAPKKEVNCDVDAEEDEEDFFEGENNIRSIR